MGCRRSTQGTGMATVETEAVEAEAVEEVKAVEELGVAAVTVVVEAEKAVEEEPMVVEELMVAVIRSRLQHAHCLRDRR
jgi:hypothetical protein